MSKLDIKHAFRLCPVHMKDWHLLGYQWRGRYYFDVVLPFGCRSAPFIFNNFADVLHWIFIWYFLIKNILHYLDDFFNAQRSFSLCKSVLDFMVVVFDWLGVPLAPDKLVGPFKVITYLGIEIDSEEFVVRLPRDKLDSIMLLLEMWKTKKKCTKKELLS